MNKLIESGSKLASLICLIAGCIAAVFLAFIGGCLTRCLIESKLEEMVDSMLANSHSTKEAIRSIVKEELEPPPPKTKSSKKT